MDFYYKDASGLTQGLSGAATYTSLSGNPQGYNNCPSTGPSPYSLAMPGYGYNISFSVCRYAPCSAGHASVASGYVTPKYVISAIVYAPPGPNSTVTCNTTTTQSTYMGSTTDTSGSFSQTLTTPSSWGGTVFGFLNGNVDVTNAATHEAQFASSNGTSLTTAMSVTQKETYGGTPVPWTGWWTTVDPATGQDYNMRNYDRAVLWLNPVLPFTAPSSTDITGYGYGYDYCYGAGPYMEIYPVQVLNLAEGASMPSDVLNTLNRPWTTSPPAGCDAEAFNSGSGALSTTDYTNIIAADPVDSESYQLSLNGGNTSTDGRYTVAPFRNGTGAELPFVQPQDEAPPQTTYGIQYTSSSEVTHQGSWSNTQTWGYSEAFSGSAYIAKFIASLANSDSLTTKYPTQSDFTDTTSKFISVTIVGPSCNWTGSACDPTYDGPQEFNVYQDDLFGTVMFWPVSN